MLSDSKNVGFVSREEIDRQKEYIELVKEIISVKFPDAAPKAFVHTYGCQGNVSDSERMKGVLSDIGYVFTQDKQEADLILFNTCAVREHAEDRVFGNVGRLKALKAENKNLIIVLCGCMVQQESVKEKIRQSYSFVDILFGTRVFHKLPEFLYDYMSKSQRVFNIQSKEDLIAEGLPVYRDGSYKAWIPIMYGCDNFCSYCIVPYVRGRERSRKSEDILKEARELIESGYKELTLLGQNVNSYGKGLDEDIDFADLLKKINDIDGEFQIRFMTSHPKDCSKKLIDTIACCKKVSTHLHLPVQSGNDRVLKEMNRKYTRAQYLELVSYAKSKIPDLSLTSDIIVGFPGETYEEFLDTLSLVKEVGYTSLFTFIYSKREGTKAAAMADNVSHKEKTVWFKQLTDTQEEIAKNHSLSMRNKVYRCLCEGKARNENEYVARTSGNVIIEFTSDEDLTGQFCDVKVTDTLTWIVKGELFKGEVK